MHNTRGKTRSVQNQAVANTRVRGVRIDDELWEAALERAKAERETVADVIRRALLAYVREPAPTEIGEGP